MTDPIVPDDLARSKSGRIPQWVVDEAKGVNTEPVPFRGAPIASLVAHRKARRKARHRETLRTVLILAVVGGIVALSVVTGVGRGSLLAGSSRPATTGPYRPVPGLGEADHRLGTPQPVVVPSTSYRFLGFQDDGKTPVTWSPCRPIDYVIRPDYAPPGGERMITESFARLAKITGLEFVYDGVTNEGPVPHRSPYQKNRYGDRWAPVLVLWATPSEIPDFGVEFAGEAAPQQVRTASGDYTYVTGVVAFDPRQLASIARSYGEGAARAIVLHELGHLMGLAHVNDKGQIMYPRSGPTITEYQAGDLAGLNVLASGPCQKDV